MATTNQQAARALSDGGVPPTDALGSTAVEIGTGGVSALGGDGVVTVTNDGGGRILAHTRIVLIFWGSAWADPHTSPSHGDFGNAIEAMLTGPWGTQLFQYRGIGPLSLEQTDLNTSSDPQTSFTDPQIKEMIEDRISGGHVPAPSAAIDRIYCVLMPTGHSSGDTSYVGQHQYYNRADGTRVYWAWVTNDGTLTGGNSLPKIFSHEVAEACTDPDLGSGITLTSAEGDEIGDVCNNTFSLVDGVAQEAYWSGVDNRCVLPRFADLPAVAGVPALVQSRFGSKGNFELVTSEASGGLMHCWRNDDNSFLPWSSAVAFGGSLGVVAASTLIQSNFGSPGNLEVVARVGDRLYHFWRDSGPVFHWNGPYEFEGGTAGTPVLIQGRFGRVGNFELVVPAGSGGLVHYWRNNDQAGFPWSGPTAFGQGLGLVDAVTLIQSNFGSPGNLEVVARVGDRLYHFWRDSGPAFHWNGPYEFEGGVAGTAALIQGRFGRVGNFELVVAASSGGLVHYWRDNDRAGLPWSGPTAFGQGLGSVDAVTLIQSNFGSPGNLEVVARVGDRLYHFWRDSGPAFHWNGPYPIRATVW